MDRLDTCVLTTVTHIARLELPRETYTMLERCRSISAIRGLPAYATLRKLKRPRSISVKSAPPPSEPKREPTQSIPVSIVGAGPAGLTLSSLLSRFGVPSVLMEKTSALPTHPQAHFINVRTMEILKHALGRLDEAVVKRCPPKAEWRDFVVCSSVLGRQFARVDNFSQGFGQKEEAHERDSFSHTGVAHLSQNILLPLLLEDARKSASLWCPSSQIVFRAEVTGLRRNLNACLEDAAPPLELLVRRGESGTNSAKSDSTSAEIDSVGCTYVVAADGAGSTVRAATGVGLSGRRELGHLVNVHFRCKDLGRVLRHRGQQAGMLSFVYNEETVSVLVAHNVQKGEWACQIPFFPPHQTAEWFTAERCLALVQHAIGPGAKSLHIEICSVRPWTMNALVADKYFEGLSGAADRTGGTENEGNGGVFLMGDAAHQFPPAGGFGLNTGVQDAHNLAWKIAAVHHGLASPELLGSYEQERRPVAMRNAALSVRNLKRSLRVVEALGVNPSVGASKLIIGRLVRSPMALKWSDGVTRVAASIWKPEERSENIIRLGRSQLQALRREGHPYGDARVRELRRLLAEGGGLPLLFPEHDIGFIYSKGALVLSAENLGDSEALTATNSPLNGTGSSASSEIPRLTNAPRSKIVVGGIMPHFFLRPAGGTDFKDEGDGEGVAQALVGNTRVPPESLFSTVDLPDQLRVSSWRNCANSPHAHAVNFVDDVSRAVRDEATGCMVVDQATREASRVNLASVLMVLPSPPIDSEAVGDYLGHLTAENESATWRRVAIDVQQGLVASAAARGNIAIPFPLVVLTVLPATDAPIEEAIGRSVRSVDAFPLSPEKRVHQYPANCHDSTVLVGFPGGDNSRSPEVVASIDDQRRYHPSMVKIAAATKGSSHSRQNGVSLMVMCAVDVSGGALGQAFAEADAEAVLIRPDGHISWVAHRGTASGKRGDPRRNLRAALKAVYPGQKVI